jgi:gamma-glutamyl:cysteine ligase YbdK (ATP-grasp superfamily)
MITRIEKKNYQVEDFHIKICSANRMPSSNWILKFEAHFSKFTYYIKATQSKATRLKISGHGTLSNTINMTH